MSRNAQRYSPHRKPRRSKPRSGHGTRPEMAEVTVAVPRDRVGMLRHYAKRLGRRRPSERDEVIARLRRHARDLETRFGVRGLLLFGSAARNETRMESDIDLLVEFTPGRPAGMFEFIDLKHWLEGIVQRPVDLVMPATLKGRIRPRVLRDAIRIF